MPIESGSAPGHDFASVQHKGVVTAEEGNSKYDLCVICERQLNYKDRSGFYKHRRKCEGKKG